MLLSQDVKTSRVVDSTAAGQTTINGDAVDCRDFDTVAFYALLGSVTAGGSGTVKAQHSDESGSGFVDVGASVDYSDSDSNGVVILEVSQPVKRYVRAVIERDVENSGVNGVIALQGKASAEPVTHDATVAGSVLALAPQA